MRIPVVAIVGRPNVGKSALFNRIVGTQSAIVAEEAGTTRDRHFARAEWQGSTFWLVDTGGVTDDPRAPLETNSQARGSGNVELILCYCSDAQAGLHPSTPACRNNAESLSRFLWLQQKSTIPGCDFEFFALGAGDPLPVSAANGKQSGDLLDAIVERIFVSVAEEQAALRVAVVGRPNVGKSSFVNRLLGEERLVVAEEAGTTRDAIDSLMRYHERDLIFVDTAGLRRQSKVSDGVEFYATLRTRRAIDRADICCLLIDATEGLQNQDLRSRRLAWEADVAVILVNKWDLVIRA